MKAKRNRKKEKRKPIREPLDEDLRDLVEALAQNAIDEGLVATLKMPWRNGWNAVRFGLDCIGDAHSYSELGVEIGDLVHRAEILKLTIEPTVYFRLEDLIADAGLHGLWRPTLRCAQLMLTKNGTGDGSVFNAVWERQLSQILPTRIERTSERMMEARCRDVLGVDGPSLQNDHNDYFRRAFKIAWSKRLYSAAYALPRCS